MSAEELNRRRGSEGVRFDTGQGGLTRATLTTRNCEAEVYLYGAHVTRFQKKGEPPILFLSEQSLYTRGKAIRGGIPVIFPWFGNHPDDPKKSAHGFARTSDWNVVSAESSPDRVSLVLRLDANETTRALWPHEFVATLTVTLDERLKVSLEVANQSTEAFQFEEALHTYITVGDLRSASVRGLEETTYIDKTDGMKRKQQAAAPLTIEKETDSVFLNTTSPCTVDDAKLKRRIVVEKEGSKSTVVWNPHSAKAKAFSDFGDDEWQRMVCVEACNVGENAVQLKSRGRHVMTTVIDSKPM